MAQDENDPPSEHELRMCASVLGRLSPTQLTETSPGMVELLETGLALFKERAVKDRFGEGDVLDFLKDMHHYDKRIKQLQKLEKKIGKAHGTCVEEATTCGINAEREERTVANAAGGDRNVHHIITAAEWEASRYVPRWAPRGPGDGTEGGRIKALPPPSFRGTWQEYEPEDDDAPSGLNSGETANAAASLGERVANIPAGDFRRSCLVCKQKYTTLHEFYHRLCPECGDFNMEKRSQTSDLSGYVCLVTGGRVRIGYEICLKLLRAGATVVATSRYPHDAAMRFARETDFHAWSENLALVGLELADLRSVEGLCELLAKRFDRIHILINNAAQTLSRQAGWMARMEELDNKACQELSSAGRALLMGSSGSTLAPLQDESSNSRNVLPSDSTVGKECQVDEVVLSEACSVSRVQQQDDGELQNPSGQPEAIAVLPARPSDKMVVSEWELKDFPAGLFDESAQPLDLSRQNSWSQRLGEVPTVELLRTLAANAAAPFVLCGKLRPMLRPGKGEKDAQWGHIINVSALEGKFSVGRKQSNHPHTNMAKAALNMLTVTSAGDLYKERVLVNCVDTGWVTDNAPGGKGFNKVTHETHVGPPLDEIDGASRVLDPIFLHLRTGWKEHGLFWNHYRVCSW